MDGVAPRPSTVKMCIFFSSISGRVLVMMNFLSGLWHGVIRAPDCVESEMPELLRPIATSNEWHLNHLAAFIISLTFPKSAEVSVFMLTLIISELSGTVFLEKMCSVSFMALKRLWGVFKMHCKKKKASENLQSNLSSICDYTNTITINQIYDYRIIKVDILLDWTSTSHVLLAFFLMLIIYF